MTKKGYKQTKKHRENISKGNTGRKVSEQTRKKIGDANRGNTFPIEKFPNFSSRGKKYPKELYPNYGMRDKKHSKESNEKNRISHLGRKFSKEITLKKLKTRKKNGWFKNPKKTKEKMRKNALKQFKDGMPEETKKKVSLAKKGLKLNLSNEDRKKKSLNSKKLWADKLWKEKQIKLVLKGLMKRPTSYEKKISELCIENSLPFIYTGNGKFLINFKNPDFVNKKDKVVIEVFYSWFKIRDYGSVENYKEFCKKKYNSVGWRVIFIDENEVDIDNWKKICLNKILDVI